MYLNPEQAFGGSAPMLQLIESVYAAASDAALWPDVLAAIARAVTGESIALFAISPHTRTPDLVAQANMPTGSWEAFTAYYAAINPIMQQCEARFSPEIPWISDLALPDAALRKTEFYNDFFRPNDMHYSMGLRLNFTGLPAAALSCQRPEAAGTFDHREQTVYETLRPHLQRALQLHFRLAQLEAHTLGLETALDAHDHAVLGLDRAGFVCLGNPSALALLAAGDGLRAAGNRLCCADPAENAALQHLIATHVLGHTPTGLSGIASPAASRGARLHHGSRPHHSSGHGSRHADGAPQGRSGVNALLISRRQTASPLHLTVFPMRGAVRGRSSPLAALVFLADTARPASRAALLAQFYGVTPAEARVADLLLAGQTLAEIAATLRLTLETTRFQTKRLLNKTGTNRQSDLLRLLSSLPGTTPSLPAEPPPQRPTS